MHQDIERNLNQVKELKVVSVAFSWPILIQFFNQKSAPLCLPPPQKKNPKQFSLWLFIVCSLFHLKHSPSYGSANAYRGLKFSL